MEKHKIEMREWRRNFPWKQSHSDAKQRCTNKNNRRYSDYGGRGIKFRMSTSDFKELWFRDKAADMKCPSIDRINTNGDYELGNCRFIEKSENSRRANGVAILQYSAEGVFIKEWNTIKEAGETLGICRPNITMCARGLYPQAGGYKWEYENKKGRC